MPSTRDLLSWKLSTSALKTVTRTRDFPEGVAELENVLTKSEALHVLYQCLSRCCGIYASPLGSHNERIAPLGEVKQPRSEKKISNMASILRNLGRLYSYFFLSIFTAPVLVRRLLS